MESVHHTELDNVHCKNDLLARALSSKHSVYIGDLLLRYDGDLLKTYKLKQDHVPTELAGQVTPIHNGTCEDYLKAGRRLGTFHKLSHLFPKHNLYRDFDEVEIGAHTWQPKLDALQEQIDDLDSTYAQDAEVVAAFADQIAESGDVFSLVTNKVAVETNRADQAEQAIQADVDQNEADGDADRALVRQEFAAADAVLDAAIQAEASTARAAESQIQADVDQNEADGDADRTAIRQEFASADAVVNQAVQTEAAAARAAEGANNAAIVVERSRIDSIMSLSDQSLNNFSAIQLAYEAADQSADSALTALVTSKVASADLATLVAQVDEVEANTLKRSNADNDQRYYQKSEVESRDDLRVLQTVYDTAIGLRQTTQQADDKYRLQSDSLSKTDAEAADGLRVLTTVFNSAIADRQTTVDQEATYRKITDSLSKQDAEDADGLRVLQTVYDTAIGLRQTTQQADDKYRLQSDSYDKGEVDARDNLRVLLTDYNDAIAARQTTVDQEATYRKIADSHHKDDVYTKTAADAEFHDKTHVNAQLLLKQDVVGNDHLAIAHTSGLQDALNAKQATVTADDLAIAHTAGLQDALNAKQATVTADDLAISHTAGLQDALNAKQATVTDDDLAISHTAGLQNALDAKAPKLDTSVLYHSTANGGRVGVGTAAPAKILHVHATAAPSGDLARFSCDGNYSIQYIANNKNFQFTHQGDNVQFYHSGVEVAKFTTGGFQASKALIVPAAVPANSAASGTAGEIRFDDSHIYICHATDSWKRVALSTFT